MALSRITEAVASFTDLTIGDDLTLTDDFLMASDASIIKFGADADVTLTHVHNTGLLLNSTSVIQFNDASQNIGAPSATVLDINATDEIELNATLIDVNGNLDVSGTIVGGGAITGGGLLTTGGNIVIPDAGNIGSASDTNAITISSGGVVAVTATTANTSASDGALTVAGGLGVAADVSIGDDLRLISDSAVLSFGADSDTTLTHTDGSGLTLNSTNKLMFNDASQFINAPSATVLDINATDEIELNATLVDVNANLDVSGTIVSGGTLTATTSIGIGSAVLTEAELETLDGITAGTAAASKALILDANKDIGTIRNLTIDGVFTDGNYTFDTSGNVSGLGTVASGAITSSGIIKTDATTAATSTTDGSLQTDGGLSVAGDAVIGDDLLLLSDGAIMKFGADSEIVLTHVADTGLRFSDSDELQFGDGGDLKIYHNASNSFIEDQGTGNFLITTNGNNITFMKNQAETMAVFKTDGICELYTDNVKKFETSATGVTVTGTAIATTDTDTSNTGNVTLDFGANQNFVLTLTGNTTLVNPSTEQVGQSGFIVLIQDGTGGRTLSLGTDYESAGGAGITLSSAASATDIVPYVVAASNRILLGAPQLAFS